MNFFSLSKQRYSVRKFKDMEVESEKLKVILEAARNAPTAHNYSPQHIFVIQTEEGLAKAESCMQCHFPSPIVLVVGYEPDIAWCRPEDGKNHGEIDASIALTQMMLQATDLGLGTVYVGMFEPEKLIGAFPEMKGTIPIAMIPLGYPADDAKPSINHEKRRALEDIVTYL